MVGLHIPDIMSDAVAANYRKCRRCGKILPITDFNPNESCRGGYEPTCKACKEIRKSQKPAIKKSSQDIDLSSISDEVLMCEIRKRGFTGELRYSRIITI